MQKLDRLIDFWSENNKNIIFLPSANNTYEYHQTIAPEGLPAFELKSMIMNEVILNNLDLRCICFFDIDEEHLAAKNRSVGASVTRLELPVTDLKRVATSVAAPLPVQRIKFTQAGHSDPDASYGTIGAAQFFLV
jgi:hypothetical protein